MTPLRFGSCQSSTTSSRESTIADRLVAEVEQVGVEERQMVVRRVGPGHVRADDLAVRVRVILVLDAHRRPERGGRGSARRRRRRRRPRARARGRTRRRRFRRSTSSPAASASSVSGITPSPATTASASSVRPGLRLDPIARTADATSSSVQHVDALLAVVLRHERRERPAGRGGSRSRARGRAS